MGSTKNTNKADQLIFDLMMQIHHFANTFPLLEGQDFEHLKESIREQGQLEPCLTYRGALIDGRNRLKACEALGLGAQFKELEGEFDEEGLRSIILALNVHRRHLTVSQKAAYWAGMVNAKVGGDRAIPSADGIEITVKQASQLSGLSPKTIERAVYVKRHDDKVYDQLQKGEVQVNEAVRLTQERSYMSKEYPEVFDALEAEEITLDQARERTGELFKKKISDGYKKRHAHDVQIIAEVTGRVNQVTCFHCGQPMVLPTMTKEQVKMILKDLGLLQS